jgi:hypothetical protein
MCKYKTWQISFEIYILKNYFRDVNISKLEFFKVMSFQDRPCGLVVRALGYRSGGPGSIPGTTRFSGGGGGQ